MVSIEIYSTLTRGTTLLGEAFGAMAHLLGSEACLESLKQDVNDVQTTVMDLLSRVGHLRSPSWKYPDKVACELDIDELLERYSYSSDEDHCKLSHIILFELLIDRYFLCK